ncbi:hypothetical protein XCCB100_0648 [Xanthomonas campestris pv. campestris]|uniref:Uncharacterized protein n=1 Tax=Xanthomonas campestris pv. campestris (strain B100) TaxID=509169 RepID=B0RNF0_XANCB|nr:hypothetical protein XCCB100_0648 [Xanthomonas campestris pv. campestris]
MAWRSPPSQVMEPMLQSRAIAARRTMVVARSTRPGDRADGRARYRPCGQGLEWRPLNMAALRALRCVFYQAPLELWRVPVLHLSPHAAHRRGHWRPGDRPSGQ